MTILHDLYVIHLSVSFHDWTALLGQIHQDPFRCVRLYIRCKHRILSPREVSDPASISDGEMFSYLLSTSTRSSPRAAGSGLFTCWLLLMWMASSILGNSDSLLLESGVDKYHFFSNGDITLPGVDDANEYEETLRAMNIVGFQDSEVQGKLRAVSTASKIETYYLQGYFGSFLLLCCSGICNSPKKLKTLTKLF